MENSDSFRYEERTQQAVFRLAAFVHQTGWSDLPEHVRHRVPPMLTDLLGVTIAGFDTPELDAVVGAWSCPPGDAPVPGTSRRTTPETAAQLAAVAACALELDEGNKHAAGHPAAHVVFAAIAAAYEAHRPVSGVELLRAIALGYEVAARFGRATTRDPRWHTHGHWGATGAACAVTLLMGGTEKQVAAAIDAATGLMHVTPWQSVLAGDFTRNLWMAGANIAGLHAARLAMADVVTNHGSAAHSLGDLVGSLQPERLVEDLGERWLVAEGYVKRHSSCSYTHAAVDLVQSLRTAGRWKPEQVRRIKVGIHSLAEPLLHRHPENRLAAMFSLPFVVSTAAVSGTVTPTTMEPGTEAFAAAEQFSARVEVSIEPRLDAYLPALRCTEVAIDLVDGTSQALAQPNPIGDTDHFPFTAEQIEHKVRDLIGPERAGSVVGVVDALPDTDSVARLLDHLP